MPRASLRTGFKIQMRVIGALILRELHTRFGRENIGYLWLIVEPMMLAGGITVAHLVAHSELEGGLDIAPFYATGYIIFMIFRSTVNRAGATIESNRTLLYHRQITLFDLVLSRNLLEIAATTLALFLILGLFKALGLGDFPARLMLMFAAIGLMGWLTFGLSMIICAAAEEWPVVERFVHPATYLMLPISGMLFLIDWLPPVARDYVRWVPITQIIELSRLGQYANLKSDYVDIPYILIWCVSLTFLGLLSLRVVRRRIDIE